MTTEPALSIGAIVAVVNAAIVLAIAFGVPITKEQAGAISAFVTVIVPLAGAVWVRSQVTPTAKLTTAPPATPAPPAA